MRNEKIYDCVNLLSGKIYYAFKLKNLSIEIDDIHIKIERQLYTYIKN